jgi:hypothetical protein
MSKIEIIFGIMVLIVIILAFIFGISKMNDAFYEFAKQDCDKNNGKLVQYSSCLSHPHPNLFFRKYKILEKHGCEFQGGILCELPDGTKYQPQMNLTN